MKIIYLSRENLENTHFIKELVYGFTLQDKVILLHDHFGNMTDTRFVTKRISALMSEQLVVNNWLSGEQRGMLSETDGMLAVKRDLVEEHFQSVQMLVLNPIVQGEGGAEAADAIRVVQFLRTELEADELLLFGKHLKSPLTAARLQIETGQEVDALLEIYDEEATVLENARMLAPVTIVSPENMSPEAVQ